MIRTLSPQRCLLVLDTCEHVLDRAAALAEGLTSSGDDVRVLATSREGLGVAGERMVAVRPLASADAVRLFHERAAERQTGFDTGPTDAELVSEICDRLDRLSVFVGGFTLAVAEAVAGADELIAFDVDDLVGSLVDKSMILIDHSGRYLLLETLRQFGEEQLQLKGIPTDFAVPI